jgi:hypothetical protein
MRTQTERRQSDSRALSRVAFIAPLVAVNLGGLVGQSMWSYGELSRHLIQGQRALAIACAILISVALESIAVYLALQAHRALMAGQASGGLRIASYAVAGVAASLNYTHFAHSSIALGVMFALSSLASPWLWAIDSRSAHRAQLAAQGIVDPRGVKLSTARKMWHPILSLRVLRWAAWAGESHPDRAVSGWQSERSPVAALYVHANIEPQVTPIERTQSAPRVEIEQAQSDAVTETVTETTTRTHSVTHSAESQRIERLRERVERVQSECPQWQSAALSYRQIGEILGIAGAATIKPVYAALYPERVSK